MIKTEFGIMDTIDPEKNYVKCEPQKYGCVAIDDDKYINDWWPRLLLIRTYTQSRSRPSFALDRYGVTLIPPESLPALQDIVISDKRINHDHNLIALADKISQAIDEQKYMIHFGV